MKSVQKLVTPLASLALLLLRTQANAQLLGDANKFAALAGASVTSTGLTVLNGNLGAIVGVSGFPLGRVENGSIYVNTPETAKALASASSAYNFLAGQAMNQDLTGQNLGGMTLTPGVYFFSSSAQLTGVLTLNAEGNANAEFDFQIGSTLTTASNATIQVINAGAGDDNIFWQVGSSATLGTRTKFEGHILAAASVTVSSGASITDGSAFAQVGSVTMDTNSIDNPAANPAPTPEPAPLLAMGLGVIGIAMKRRTRGSGASTKQ